MAPVPSWFVRALAEVPENGSVTVHGEDIAYAAWGRPTSPGLVFVHGGGAHRGWWDHIAPWFSGAHRVVALDLSGHGDSGHRTAYDLGMWVNEVLTAARAAGIDGPPVLVGHSMGGFVTIAAASNHGSELAGVIVIDSPVSSPDPEVISPDLKNAGRSGRAYRTLDEVAERFRTVPAQPTYLSYVMDHVARRSARQTPDGWRWKYDARIFAEYAPVLRRSALPNLRRVNCRFALLAAEHGLVTPDVGAVMYEALGRAAPVVTLPESGHHPMLDQPLVLVSAIRALLADWQHSVPGRQPGVA